MVKKERKAPWPSTKEENRERSKEILKGSKLPHVKKKILMQLACKRGAKCNIKSSNVQQPGSVIQAEHTKENVPVDNRAQKTALMFVRSKRITTSRISRVK